MPTDPQHVLLWDFDGTLAERPGRWSGAISDALTEAAGTHDYTRQQIRAVMSTGYPWHEPQVPHPHLAEPDQWWRHLTCVITASLGRLGIPDAEASAAAQLVRSQYCRPDQWRLFDDTLPALDRLTAAGWRHVLVSNHVPELGDILASLGLAGQFTAVVNSAVTGYEKPHPRAFELALAAGGHPRVAWMIGDNPVADIGGAARAGLPGILVRTQASGGSPAAVMSLSELPGLLPPLDAAMGSS